MLSVESQNALPFPLQWFGYLSQSPQNGCGTLWEVLLVTEMWGLCRPCSLFTYFMENHLLYHGLLLGRGPWLKTPRRWGHLLWTITSKIISQTNLIFTLDKVKTSFKLLSAGNKHAPTWVLTC